MLFLKLHNIFGFEWTNDFDMANQTLGWWRDGLRDMWNVAALHGGIGYHEEGQPLANSHYGYHMVAWHLLFALSFFLKIWRRKTSSIVSSILD